MRPQGVLATIILVMALSLGYPLQTPAAVVGHITQTEGRVDLLKGGKLPANPVKVGDPVDTGDVLRSKSLSKAQITFIDNSVVTISPESRLAIEDYQVEPAQGKRHAVLELFQGLAHVVVSQIFKVKEPDFLIKTHTAITGVRGTDFGVRLYPNNTAILNFKGKTQVGNVFPEVTSSLTRAQKIAYGTGGGGWFTPGSFVMLNEMQSTTVHRNLPPTLPMPISAEDQTMFMQQMAGGLLGKRNSSDGGAGGGAGGGDPGPMVNTLSSGSSSSVPASTTLGLVAGTGNTTLAILNTVTVPPTVAPAAAAPQTQTQTPTPIAPIPVAGMAIPVFNILTSWGAGGVDLDLHLTGPSAGSTFHVYYGSKGSLTTQPYALLHVDDTGSSGSEVITVQQFNTGGLYQAYVYNFGNPSTSGTNLSTASGVSMSVINGGTVVSTSGGGSTVTGGTLVTSLTPTAGQVGNTWVAITIDPATGQVTATNQITNSSGGVLGAPALAPGSGSTGSAEFASPTVPAIVPASVTAATTATVPASVTATTAAALPASITAVTAATAPTTSAALTSTSVPVSVTATTATALPTSVTAATAATVPTSVTAATAAALAPTALTTAAQTRPAVVAPALVTPSIVTPVVSAAAPAVTPSAAARVTPAVPATPPVAAAAGLPATTARRTR
ncbi:MAG: FecR family protein [Desulfobaccales bacterium]